MIWFRWRETVVPESLWLRATVCSWGLVSELLPHPTTEKEKERTTRRKIQAEFFIRPSVSFFILYKSHLVTPISAGKKPNNKKPEQSKESTFGSSAIFMLKTCRFSSPPHGRFSFVEQRNVTYY